MAEQMTELQLMFQERQNTGTAWTRNESFDKNGYLVIKDLWDAEELYHPESIISGVFYVKAPDKSSMLRFFHPSADFMVRDWNVDLKCNMYTSSIWEILPEEGKLLLFPSWLEHEVDQNLSQEKRISISFNLVGES